MGCHSNGPLEALAASAGWVNYACVEDWRNVPKTIAVAVNRATQVKDFGTIRMKLLARRAPISDSTVPLLEILDILQDARRVPAAKVARVIQVMTERLSRLTPAEGRKLQRLALEYYNPGTRALLGMLLARCQIDVMPTLKASLNPTTHFDLGIDPDEWPESRAWNIR